MSLAARLSPDRHKRGGGKQPISIDAEWADSHSKKTEPAGGESPEVLFDRQWALTVLDRAIAQLRQTYSEGGKQQAFEALLGTISPSAAKRPLAEIATELVDDAFVDEFDDGAGADEGTRT